MNQLEPSDANEYPPTESAISNVPDTVSMSRCPGSTVTVFVPMRFTSTRWFAAGVAKVTMMAALAVFAMIVRESVTVVLVVTTCTGVSGPAGPCGPARPVLPVLPPPGGRILVVMRLVQPRTCQVFDFSVSSRSRIAAVAVVGTGLVLLLVTTTLASRHQSCRRSRPTRSTPP